MKWGLNIFMLDSRCLFWLGTPAPIANTHLEARCHEGRKGY